MPKTAWKPERPCPIPGHPQDATDAPVLITESAWQRIRAWHLHAPAERLPLPVILTAWPASWVMRAFHVTVTVPGISTAVAAALAWAAWHRHRKRSPHPRLAPVEAAAVTAACGGWVTAAVTWGPLAGPYRMLTIVYVTGAAAVYWWLRTHEAVRAARQRRDDLAAELADRRRWHEILPRAGLGGWHVQWRQATNLGEERLITTSPENARATRTAANSAAIAETLAHILGLPYGRIDVTTTDYPGELIISIRTVDMTTRRAAYHPMTTPWPETGPSPFAHLFPETASIAEPVIWGFRPEDGTPLVIRLFTERGGWCVGAQGSTGSGKSNVLNVIREKVTRCPDARLGQINGAHSVDELTWQPLAAFTEVGDVRNDEEARKRIAARLDALCHLVTERSAKLAATGHSVFQPTAGDPALVVIIDEVDAVVQYVPDAGKALEFLASKQRKSGMALVLAAQRYVVASIGGGGVRANMKEVLGGNVSRATESRHVTGAETEIPDIREYSKGEPGYFQIWDPDAKAITGRGRAFILGVPPEEPAYIKRLVAARQHLRDWSLPDMPPLDLDGQDADGADDATRQQIDAMRSRLASIQPAATAPQPAPAPPAPAPSSARYPAIHGVPPAAVARLIQMLASDRVSAASAGLALGVSKTVAHEYLSAMRKHGLVELDSRGRASAWQLARRPGQDDAPPPGPPAEAVAGLIRGGLIQDVDENTRATLMQAPGNRGCGRQAATGQPGGEPGPRPYVTVGALADAVHNGLIGDIGDDAREVLEQAWAIAHGDSQ